MCTKTGISAGEAELLAQGKIGDSVDWTEDMHKQV